MQFGSGVLERERRPVVDRARVELGEVLVGGREIFVKTLTDKIWNPRRPVTPG